MKKHSGTSAEKSRNAILNLSLVASPVLAWALLSAPALAGERSGKDIVQATCGECHVTGKDKAPRIGDQPAWSKLAARGLTGLTQSALAGIRKMPAHGGSANASDLEISRAIAYMVNQSGGRWVEPAGKPVAAPVAPAIVERSGKRIVETQCGKCHLTGESGAPLIGDRAAWVQRLKRGMDDVVRSAFNGHGPMPARGGLADITFNEMRNAITYMFNPASAIALAPVAKVATPQSPNHKVVGNSEIFFGITPAETIRASQKDRKTTPIADVPDGADYYHINVSLRDRITQTLVTHAQVEARVEDPAQRGETKALEILAINQGISYGGFFRLPTKGRYVITVKIQRPDAPPPVEARFEFNRN